MGAYKFHRKITPIFLISAISLGGYRKFSYKQGKTCSTGAMDEDRRPKGVKSQ